jgi:hypothetical protein
MDANFHTQAGRNGQTRIARPVRATEGCAMSDGFSAAPAVKRPSAREIADAIVRFVLTGARG